ncbi:MAG: helix-hairpin-helix domain-containing protein [Candidatus Delongbacteria bacterium]|nr:helix-hairpin-helix domain-containing protein [Candidatus Delongbacteria bacterium]
MSSKENSNIVNSTYKGLLAVTLVLFSVFIFKTLLFSFEIHSYEDHDKKLTENKLFAEDDNESPSSEGDSTAIERKKNSSDKQNTEQKNIIKDLTVKQKIVNINESSEDELNKLPGIGPKTAKKIIDYRKENGAFQDKNDLLKVKGIGPSKLKKIEDLIKLK